MAVGEKVYIADKATQDEINQNVDGIVNNIGTTTDSGATSTTGTLMGKTNELLEIANENKQKYYFSKDDREVLVSTQYTVTSSKQKVSLGQWTAKRDGIITIKSRLWSNTGGEAAYFKVFCGKSNNLSWMDSNMIIPAGSYFTSKNGIPIIKVSTKGNEKKAYYCTLYVNKGDMFAFSLEYNSSVGYIDKVSIGYADE